jgi:hypothetical protein
MKVGPQANFSAYDSFFNDYFKKLPVVKGVAVVDNSGIKKPPTVEIGKWPPFYLCCSRFMWFKINSTSLSLSVLIPSTAFWINCGLESLLSKNSAGVISKYSQIEKSSVNGGSDFPDVIL